MTEHGHSQIGQKQLMRRVEGADLGGSPGILTPIWPGSTSVSAARASAARDFPLG